LTVSPRSAPLGVWLIGARGAISTCLAYGVFGLRRGLLGATGVVTDGEPFCELPLASEDDLVFGGHEVSTRDLSASVGELVQAGVLPGDLAQACAEEGDLFSAATRPGILDAAEVGGQDLDPRSAELGALLPREQVARVIADWDSFEAENKLDGMVVVDLSSTEAQQEARPAWQSLAAFEEELDSGRSQPASVLYAYAALSSGRPLVNFTPNRSASIPALMELAEKKGVAHAGRDGKTGETLLKTALAPMFTHRALKVHAWQGYNMLGNRDGAVLSDSAHRATKIENKDRALRELLGDGDELHTGVGIDYVPSLGDWKTAMDLVHFEGFLGARMTLQMTWMGSDSALAAPLVLDLIRLVDFAQRAGEGGSLTATACFFKAPVSGGSHDFHQQHAKLVHWAEKHLAEG
jgi:myo-inositol-1-phosphate synthase